MENKGLDVFPFLKIYEKIKLCNYVNITKLHGKTSNIYNKNGDFGENWRKALYISLIKDKLTYIQNCNKLINNIFLIGNKNCYYTMERDKHNYPVHFEYIKEAANLCGILPHGEFIAGSMFMCSGYYLNLLLKNVDISKLVNKFKMGYNRNTLSHGFERILGYGVKQLGGVIELI